MPYPGWKPSCLCCLAPRTPKQEEPKAESQSVFTTSPDPLEICTFLCIPITFREESPPSSLTSLQESLACAQPLPQSSHIAGLCHKSAVRKRSFTSLTTCVPVDGARAAREQPGRAQTCSAGMSEQISSQLWGKPVLDPQGYQGWEMLNSSWRKDSQTHSAPVFPGSIHHFQGGWTFGLALSDCFSHPGQALTRPTQL